MVVMWIVVGLLAALTVAAVYDTIRRRKLLEATLSPAPPAPLDAASGGEQRAAAHAAQAQYRADHPHLHGGRNGGEGFRVVVADCCGVPAANDEASQGSADRERRASVVTPGSGDGWKRRTGLIVLTALLLGLIMVAATRDRLLPGDPIAAPIDAAPHVGDCIQQNPVNPDIDLYPAAAPLPTLPSGPCSGFRYGEVVSVADGYPDDTDLPVPGRTCLERTFSYLGVPTPPPPPDLPVGPAISIWYALLGPDTRQRAAGQNWAACVVFPPPSIDESAPVALDHSLQGAWHQAVDRRLFAQCLNQVGLVAPSCSFPHSVEVISRLPGDRAASTDVVHAACIRDVVEALGSPAALNRGELTVLAIPALPDPAGDGLSTGSGAVTADSAYVNNCMITPTDANKLLIGSVLGLQDAPIPLK